MAYFRCGRKALFYKELSEVLWRKFGSLLVTGEILGEELA